LQDRAQGKITAKACGPCKVTCFRGEEKKATPFRQMRRQNAENLDFSPEIDPLRQLIWRAEGGVAEWKMLEVRAFLAFRQLATLAERVGSFWSRSSPRNGGQRDRAGEVMSAIGNWA
jgi:hypothetical protein